MKFLCARRCVGLASAWLILGLAGCASKVPAPVVERASPPMTAETPVAKPAAIKDGYVVKKGDTLYSIALDHGLDYKELASWNSLDNPNRILIGQVLRTTPPGVEASTSTVAIAQPIGVAGSVEQRSLDGNSVNFKREPKAGKEPYSDEAYARLQQGGGIAPPAKVDPKPVAKAEPRSDAKPEPRPEAKAEVEASGDDPLWTWPAAGKVLAGFNDSTNKGVDIAGKAGDPVLAAGDGKVVYSGTGLRGYGQLVIVKHNATYLSAYAHNSRIMVKEGQTVTRGQKIAEMGNTDADQVKLHFEVRRQGKPVDPLKYLPAR